MRLNNLRHIFVILLVASGRAEEQSKLPLHEVAMMTTAPDPKALASLIKTHKAQLEDRNVDGQTALHAAAANGVHEVVTALVKAGANVEALDKDGRTPMHWAIAEVRDKSSTFRKIKALKKGGAHINGKGTAGLAPLHVAAHMNSGGGVRVLVDSGANVEEPGPNGTPLHHAALAGANEAIAALVKKKANLEAASHTNGYRPLHCAVMTDKVEAMTTLVSLGASLEGGNAQGLTPLQFAVTIGNVKSIERLVALGANVHARGGGITPFELATVNVTILRALNKDEL